MTSLQAYNVTSDDETYTVCSERCAREMAQTITEDGDTCVVDKVDPGDLDGDIECRWCDERMQADAYDRPAPSRLFHIGDRSMSTILGALRHWQGTTRGVDRAGDMVATDCGRFLPLTDDEIDDLCEELNSAPLPRRLGLVRGYSFPDLRLAVALSSLRVTTDALDGELMGTDCLSKYGEHCGGEYSDCTTHVAHDPYQLDLECDHAEVETDDEAFQLCAVCAHAADWGGATTILNAFREAVPS